MQWFFIAISIKKTIFNSLISVLTSKKAIFAPNFIRKKIKTTAKMTKMRVRFAPSPTGALHIGGVRTALYNYLLAKKMGGTFVLRIEDTDQTRYVEGAENYIIEALEWLGLEFDESPEKGGEYGPYRQSERKATGIYEKFAEQLVANGHAYYAFDTAEELTNQRNAVEARGQKFKYDATTRLQLNNSLALSQEATQKLLDSNTPKVIRLKIPAEETISFEDMVRGVVKFDSNELDDKVMLKADGMPTYHLANIVDDYHMKITHVIRGEEWLPSTPTHVLLYRFFGWADVMPTFAHLPLILKPEPAAYINKKTVGHFAEHFAKELVTKEPEWQDQQAKVQNYIQQLLQDIKSIAERLKINENKDSKLQKAVKGFLRDTMNGKLSKRDGDRLGMPVFPLDWQGEKESDFFRGFREWGFLPEAVINLLALLGWNDGTDQEIYTIEELIAAFDMSRVASGGARFSFDKAKWFNKQYLSTMSSSKLADLVQPRLEEVGIDAERNKIEQVAEMLKPRIGFVTDFVEQSRYLFEDIDLAVVGAVQQKNIEKKVLKNWSETQPIVTNLIEKLNKVTDFKSATLANQIEPLIAENKGQVLPVFRLALSGEMGGPDVYDIMDVLGQQKTVERLQDFVAFCSRLSL